MDLSWKQLILVFLPAILLVSGVLAVRVFQYKPLYPETSTKKESQKQLEQVPIFPNDPIIGKKSAAKTVIAFEDLSCGACKQQHLVFKKLIKKHPNKVKVVWKGMPIKQIPVSSKEAHRYAFCMNRQAKFEEFSDLALANSNNLIPSILKGIANRMEINSTRLENCLNSNQPDKYIQKTKQLAKILNIQSVPAVFVNDQEVRKPGTVAGWEAILNINE